MDNDRKTFFMTTVEIRILIAVLTRITHRSVDERLNAHTPDLSGLQFGILRTLAQASRTLSELSKQFVLDPSTLVPVIDALERKGLVTRGKAPNDRRRIPLALTPEGVALIRSLPLFHEEDLLYRSLSEIGESKTHELRNLLREVVQQMPEGAEMLEAVTSRIYALRGGENVTESQHCIMQQGDQGKVEQEPILPRTTRRRVRRSHTS